MLDFFLDIVIPQDVCCICRKPGRYGSRHPWCHECLNKMKELQTSSSICDKCGKYLPEGGELCSDCQNNPPRFDISRSVGPYEDPFRISTKVLKFMGRKYLGRRMGDMMAERVKGETRFWPLDLIVPVPISRGSLKQRGFNQTELLGGYIAKDLQLKMNAKLIHRIKETPAQRELSREEREKNLLYAFEIYQKDYRKVKDKNVLLIDDVYTTGSTCRECTRVLLDAGAKRVCIITWATGKSF